MMIIYAEDCLEEEDLQNLKKENNVFYSESENYFIMTDKTFNYIENKYKDLKNAYTHDNIKDWIDMAFEDEQIEIFNNAYDIIDCSELVSEIIIDKINEEENIINFITTDWVQDIKEYLIDALLIGISGDLEEELKKINLAGGDIEILKHAFDFVGNKK